eukprot:TRINITY_DN7423_c1_g2_i1.p1 TRINITY_DN7423_c1_g2~~TRINITY_DN7423_c1_g2_i1.p1  ORF type:complete len:328 (-),score=93.05 TRINITY_DN7423_c1_g2_i1:454-1437(-)
MEEDLFNLQQIHYNLITDLDILQEKLAIDIPDVEFHIPDEPIDIEKKNLREKVSSLETQERQLAERYVTLHSHISKLRTDTYKIKQKIKYKISMDEYNATHSPLHKYNDYDTYLENEKENETITLPEDLSLEEQIEFLQKQLKNTQIENKSLKEKVDEYDLQLKKNAIFNKNLIPANEIDNNQNESSPIDQDNNDLELKGIYKSGYLLKKGGKGNNKWQKRYFILSYSSETNIYLLTYKNKDKGQIKGQIALPWCTTRYDKQRSKNDNFVFVVTPRMTDKKKKNYLLASSSEKDMNEWMSLIDTASKIIPSAEDILRANKYFMNFQV